MTSLFAQELVNNREVLLRQSLVHEGHVDLVGQRAHRDGRVRLGGDFLGDTQVLGHQLGHEPADVVVARWYVFH